MQPARLFDWGVVMRLNRFGRWAKAQQAGCDHKGTEMTAIMLTDDQIVEIRFHALDRTCSDLPVLDRIECAAAIESYIVNGFTPGNVPTADEAKTFPYRERG